MPDSPDGSEIAVQAALPSLELPDFEGIRPVGVITKVNGTGERIGRAMRHGERVVLLVEAEVIDVHHPRTKAGIKRSQVLTALDLYELEGKPGRRILSAAKQAYRVGDDMRHGRLPGVLGDRPGFKLTPEGWTDSSGNILTEEDLAQIRGEGLVRAAADPTFDAVVLVFGDGSRAKWPDDYPSAELGQDPPHAGEEIGDARIREVLDAHTGETLEEWSDADEDARLAKLEAEAEAAEAAGDAEAIAELEAGRDSDVEVTEGQAPDGSCSSCGRKPGTKHLKACYFVAEQVDPPEANELAGDDEPSFEEPAPGIDKDTPAPSASSNGSAPDAEIELDVDDAGEPWDGYDGLGVEAIKNRVRRIEDRDRVFEIAAYEEAHKKRKGVLEACAHRAAEIFSEQAPRAELEDAPAGFEVPPDAIEHEADAEDALARQYANADGGDDE